MAMTIRWISKVKLSLLSNNITRHLIYNGSRTICSEVDLKMTEYRRNRLASYDKYQTATNYLKFRDLIGSEDRAIHPEDLKVLLHLIERTPTDIDILKKSIERYNSPNNESSGTQFVFGPIVMRTLHYLNEADLAKELFLNPKFETFFNHYSTILILFDLLYINGKYQDICDIYDKIKERFIFVASVQLCTIAVLSCYKLNTPESLAYGMNLLKYFDDKNVTLMHRQYAMLAALAFNQDQPETALKILEIYSNRRDHITIRSVKVLALAHLEKLPELVESFECTVQRDGYHKDKYCKDIIPRVQVALENFDVDPSSKIYDLIEKLKQPEFVHELTLDEYLTRPILVNRNEPSRTRFGDEKRWTGQRGKGIFDHNSRFKSREQIYDSAESI